MLNRKFALWLGLVPLALGAMFFVACGGDDDDGGGGGGGTGSDEDFVDDLCKAGANFAKDLDKIGEDLNEETDPEKISDAISEPFEDFANAFKKLNPPRDLKDWHDDASNSLDDVVESLKGGNLDAGALGEDPFPEMPKEAEERLTKLAEENEDCQDSDFDFSE
jgi:hypothetical protein